MTDTAIERRPRGRPRTTGNHTCDRCRRSTGKIRIRWPDGDICGICFHEATRTRGNCDQCGQHRLLPGRDGDRQLCRTCAGIVTDLDCHRCGAEGEHHRRGLCTRCTLRDDLNALLLPPAPRSELVRLVDVLANVDRPESIHTWKRNPKVDQLLRGIGDGTILLTHDGFDDAAPSPAREHIRELLVHHGLLPRRDPDLASFERWLQQRLDSIDDPTVRRPLEQFARWHHLRRIRRRLGQELRGAVHTSKQEITEVGRFLEWLAGRDKSIGNCTQADVDEYLAGGTTTRHLIRTFTVWSSKQRVSPPLTIGFRQARSARMITQDERLDWLGRCLVGDLGTVPYRVAAALLLLYAQPLVKVAALRTDQVQVAPIELRILLGKEPAAIPEPFAQLLREHLAARPNLRTANTNGSPWLFPSTRAGQHLHPNSIMDRLRDLGIDLLGTRNATLRDLVRRVPAPIVATQLGYSHQVTQRHAELAAQPMSRYAAIRIMKGQP
ncbi:MAG: recombinase XerD [Actinomycetota bacterium]|nr:recombinase XerD [Actinomycetota bacterium]